MSVRPHASAGRSDTAHVMRAAHQGPRRQAADGASYRSVVEPSGAKQDIAAMTAAVDAGRGRAAAVSARRLLSRPAEAARSCRFGREAERLGASGRRGGSCGGGELWVGGVHFYFCKHFRSRGSEPHANHLAQPGSKRADHPGTQQIEGLAANSSGADESAATTESRCWWRATARSSLSRRAASHAGVLGRPAVALKSGSRVGEHGCGDGVCRAAGSAEQRGRGGRHKGGLSARAPDKDAATASCPRH